MFATINKSYVPLDNASDLPLEILFPVIQALSGLDSIQKFEVFLKLWKHIPKEKINKVTYPIKGLTM